ncbi:hypothetical protein FB451DRAFT_1398088 [Mycena latifolia]|nr:hypothetical protein FB451DRAFT_1398088 [Mycena latifolia]
MPSAVRTGSGAGAKMRLKMRITALPPVLVLHVERSYYDWRVGFVELAKRVAFGPQLENRDVLAPDLNATVPMHSDYHSASSIRGPHTLEVLHGPRKWVHIDGMSDVRGEVFGFSEKGVGDGEAPQHAESRLCQNAVDCDPVSILVFRHPNTNFDPMPALGCGQNREDIAHL